jgi:hypothetical protein
MRMNVIGPGFVAGLLVGFAIGLAIAVAVGGLLLYWSVRWLEKFAPSFKRCFLAVFAAVMVWLLVNAALGAVLQLTTGATGIGMGFGTFGALVALLSLAICVISVAGAVHWLVHGPGGGALPLGRSLRVAAVFVALGVGIYFVLVAGSVLLLGGVPGVSR